MTALATVGKHIETPTPATISGATRVPYPTPGVTTAASQPSPAACMTRPATMNGRLPILSASAPATGATSMGVAIQTRIRRPAWSGE